MKRIFLLKKRRIFRFNNRTTLIKKRWAMEQLDPHKN
jgi:hypothetical protein